MAFECFYWIAKFFIHLDVIRSFFRFWYKAIPLFVCNFIKWTDESSRNETLNHKALSIHTASAQIPQATMFSNRFEFLFCLVVSSFVFSHSYILLIIAITFCVACVCVCKWHELFNSNVRWCHYIDGRKLRIL